LKEGIMSRRKLSRRDFVRYSAIALPLSATQRRQSCAANCDIPPLLDGFSPVIDCHSHVGEDHSHLHEPAMAEDCVAMMDRCGIERACTSAPFFLEHDFREGNRLIYDVVKRFPSRLIGFCIADPLHARESVQELDRWLGEREFAGVKFHISFNGVAHDDRRYVPIYEKVAEYGVPILAHTFSVSDVQSLLKAAIEFPAVPFLVGHSGGHGWRSTIDAIAAVENAYFDITCSNLDRGRIEAFVKAGGAGRVLFGTDSPLHDPALECSKVLHADLSNDDKQQILGGNVSRLIKDRL
jgi:predicted TIM-barrel fold metal-dependent hydrolase